MEAIVSDFDGVIITSEKHWRPEEQVMFHKLMPKWKDEDHPRIVGMTMEDTYIFLKEEFALSVSPEEFLEMYNQIADRVYSKSELIEGVIDFFDSAKASGMKVCIASSAQKRNIDIILERYDLADYFESITCADEIPEGKGKPDPALYLIAAEKLNIDPSKCIAIEDASNGVQSAKAAGMYCIGFRNGGNDDQDFSEADRIINRYDELDIEELRKMNPTS